MNKIKPFEPFKEASADPVLFKVQINSLIESYAGQWDVLVELIQNAVDALELKFRNETDFSRIKPTIEIEINIQTEILRVSDNGVGINEQNIKKILAPNFTTKQLNPSAVSLQRGHKGVGLSYVAYFTNLFKIYTKTKEFEFSAELRGGKDWAEDKNPQLNPPSVYPYDKFQPEFFKKYETGSSVQVEAELLKSKNLISWLGWVQVLRTQTALGFCSIVSNAHNNDYPQWAKNLEIQLTITSKDGDVLFPKNKQEKKLLKFEYFYPHEYFEQSCNLLSLYEKYNGEPVPTVENNKYLGIWRIWSNQEIFELIRKEKDYKELCAFAMKYSPKIYAFYSYSQTIWQENKEDFSTDNRRKFWRPGIHLATENMPVGRPIEIDLNSEASSNERTIVVIECIGLRPDYGRKGFSDIVYTFSRAVAKNANKSFGKNKRYLKLGERSSSSDSSGDPEDDAKRVIRNAEDLPKLQISTPYTKDPISEQGVIGLFCVLVGMRKILGYEIYSISSNAQYDGVIGFNLDKGSDRAIYSENNKLGVLSINFKRGGIITKMPNNLEFKYLLSDLVKQFDLNESSSKQLELIQWAVAWDIGDLKAIEKKGLVLEDITEDAMIVKREFHSVTHLLYLPNGGKKIHVIILKKAIELFALE